MTNAELAAALAAIAAKHVIPCRCGNGATLDVSPTVYVRGQSVYVAIECNGTITKSMACEVINAIRREFADSPAAVGTMKAKKLAIAGIWHMGRFSPSSVSSRHEVAA